LIDFLGSVFSSLAQLKNLPSELLKSTGKALFMTWKTTQTIEKIVEALLLWHNKLNIECWPEWQLKLETRKLSWKMVSRLFSMRFCQGFLCELKPSTEEQFNQGLRLFIGK